MYVYLNVLLVCFGFRLPVIVGDIVAVLAVVLANVVGSW